MKNPLRLLSIFILLSFFPVSSIQAAEPRIKEGGVAADFKLQDLSRNTFTLSNYKDKQPLILFFWTTWCPYCRRELRVLNDMYPQLLKEGWELFAINVGESVHRVDNFLKDYSLTFKILLDKHTTVAAAYDIFGVPTYVIVDKKGYIVFKDSYFPRGKYKELIAE